MKKINKCILIFAWIFLLNISCVMANDYPGYTNQEFNRTDSNTIAINGESWNEFVLDEDKYFKVDISNRYASTVYEFEYVEQDKSKHYTKTKAGNPEDIRLVYNARVVSQQLDGDGNPTGVTYPFWNKNYIRNNDVDVFRHYGYESFEIKIDYESNEELQNKKIKFRFKTVEHNFTGWENAVTLEMNQSYLVSFSSNNDVKWFKYTIPSEGINTNEQYFFDKSGVVVTEIYNGEPAINNFTISATASNRSSPVKKTEGVYYLRVYPVSFYEISPSTEIIYSFGDNPKKPLRVTVNGEKVVFDQQPIIQNGRTLVPLRAIFEQLDASVEWINDTNTVVSKKDNIEIKLTIGSDQLFVNGVAKTIDVPAQIVNNRTMVPARAIAEAFGCKVDWDESNQTVVIN